MTIATKRKGSRKRSNGDKYFKLIEHAADGIAILQDGVFKLVNTALTRISGYDKEELLGMPFTKLLTPESQKLTVARYQARLAGKEVPAIYEAKAVTKNGEVRDIEINAALTEYEGRVADEVIIRDITERKRVEKQLRQSESKYRTLTENLPQKIFLKDKNSVYVSCNENYARDFKFKPNEIASKTDYDIFPSELAEKYRTDDERIMTLGRIEDIEEKYIQDGQEITVQTVKTPVKDESGNPIGILGIFWDITERKQVEDALRKSKASLTEAQRMAHIGSWDWDTVKNEISYSDELHRIFGRHVWNLKTFLNSIHPDDREFVEKSVNEALYENKPYNIEYRITLPDESQCIVQARGEVTRDKAGQPLKMIGTVQDITERKHVEKALQESEDKFRRLAEQSPNMIFINKEGRTVYANKRCETITGYTRQEFYSPDFDFVTLMAPEFRDSVRANFNRHMKGEDVPPYEFALLSKDGKRFEVILATTLIEYEGHTAILGVLTDITERKRVEEALSNSEQRYRSLVEGAPDVIYTISKDGVITSLNPAFETITRWSCSEWIGKHFPSLIHPDDLPFVIEWFQNDSLWRTPLETPPRLEVRILTKSGEYVVMEFRGIPLIQGGEVVSFLGTARDITERKQMEQQLQEKNEQLDAQNEELRAINEELRATEQHLQEKNEQLDAQNEELKAINEELRATEEELQQSQEKLERMFESVTEGIVVANLDGTILKVNKKAVQMHGFASDNELLGKNTIELIAPGDRERKVNNVRKALKEGFIRNQEYNLLRADGSEFPAELSTSALKDASGNVIGRITIVRDITERRQAEEVLRESEEKWRSLVDNAPNIIMLIDGDGIIQFINRTVSGFDSKDTIGTSLYDYIQPEHHDIVKATFSRVLKTGKIDGYEIRGFGPDGNVVWYDTRISPIKHDSEVAGMILVNSDITERKQMEEREKRLQQELNLTSRLASIGQLAAGVAHEINNPLTGVIGFSHLLMSRDIPDDMKQDLKVINSEAQRVAKIVENLLTFAHQRKPGREYVDINGIIARVLELRAYEMKVNNIEVETQLAPDLPYTMADAGQLQQVFLNIVLNAEYFMTKTHNKGKLMVKTERINDNIRASFTDDGLGISKENLDKVFNPFFTTKEVGSGTGLGLSICHGIVTQHKGRIYARSQLGQGATFVIELPIMDDSTQAGQTGVIKKEEIQKPRGAKILVVDDEPAILAFLHRLLTEWGHSVETINNADAALDRLKTERYSLILLDIKMPGISGVELYRHIEAMTPALTRRIVFITGDVMETATRDFLDKTKAPHITKPLNIELLKKTINHTLNQTQVAAITPG